jgi:FAD/FMN-containing dehydrogenase
MDAQALHRDKCIQLAAELVDARASGAPVGLRKSHSNLFRRRDTRGKSRVDVRPFVRVLSIDRERMLADVEGMTTYQDFVAATLPHSLLPAVVPQLKTITVGGAVSGLGIESSSFKFGLVHETVEEMEILLGDGSIVVCSPSQDPDLFFGFPNSYGTLGYALRLKVKLIPARPYVHLTHTRFTDPAEYFARIAEECSADYLDGVIFGDREMFLTRGTFSSDAPRLRNYTYMGIYYRSIQRLREDWLTARDYIWRWDTDWFWCSKQFGVQHPALRALVPWALNSRTYQKIMRLSQTLLPDSRSKEAVIQDVDIPIHHAEEFFWFLRREIGITPVWVCPFRSHQAWDLSPLAAEAMYINFGFWDMIKTTHAPGFFNRKVEEKARDLSGAKALYSSSYYDEQSFWSIYNRERYHQLKRTYDPTGTFPDLYTKVCRAGFQPAAELPLGS